MTELLVIRHGETDWNRQHRFQGQIDVPLNDNGLAQADRLAHHLRDEPLDLVITSDLQRARATAEAVVRQHRRGAELLPLPEVLWREQAFGVLEGLDLAAIVEQHPALWTQWLRHEADFAPPGGGESNVMFHARVMRALQALLAAHEGRRVAVFSHGGVLDMLWRTVQGQPLAGARSCNIPNTGVNRLRWDAGALHIVQWAQADHLHDQPPLATLDPTRIAHTP